MPIQTQELHPGFAAEAGFLDLSRPLDADAIAGIQVAIDAYPVLVFRDQRLTDAQLRDFAAGFGPLEIGRSAARAGRRRLAIPQIGDISNLDEDNKVRALMIAGGWTVSATGCGTPMRPTCRCRSCSGMLHAVSAAAAKPVRQRRDRVCRHARGLRRAAARDQGCDRSADRRTRCFLVARRRSASPSFPQGEREQYPPSRQRLVRRHTVDRPQKPIFVRPCFAYHRLAGRRRASVAAGSDRPRDATSFRLQPHLACWRSGDLGQSLDDAPRSAAR